MSTNEKKNLKLSHNQPLDTVTIVGEASGKEEYCVIVRVSICMGSPLQSLKTL